MLCQKLMVVCVMAIRLIAGDAFTFGMRSNAATNPLKKPDKATFTPSLEYGVVTATLSRTRGDLEGAGKACLLWVPSTAEQTDTSQLWPCNVGKEAEEGGQSEDMPVSAGPGGDIEDAGDPSATEYLRIDGSMQEITEGTEGSGRAPSGGKVQEAFIHPFEYDFTKTARRTPRSPVRPRPAKLSGFFVPSKGSSSTATRDVQRGVSSDGAMPSESHSACLARGVSKSTMTQQGCATGTSETQSKDTADGEEKGDKAKRTEPAPPEPRRRWWGGTRVLK